MLGRPVLVPCGNVTSLGAAIFAFLAAGVFKTVEEAQDKICSSYKVYEPQKEEQKVYDRLHAVFNQLYFSFGQSGKEIGSVLPTLIEVAG